MSYQVLAGSLVIIYSMDREVELDNHHTFTYKARLLCNSLENGGLSSLHSSPEECHGHLSHTLVTTLLLGTVASDCHHYYMLSKKSTLFPHLSLRVPTVISERHTLTYIFITSTTWQWSHSEVKNQQRGQHQTWKVRNTVKQKKWHTEQRVVVPEGMQRAWKRTMQ